MLFRTESALKQKGSSARQLAVVQCTKEREQNL